MKRSLGLLIFAGALVICVSCHKTLSSNTVSGTSGRWDLVVDSMSEGAGATNHMNTYKGKDGDYFDFRSDSNLYIMEDGKSSVYTYHIDSDTTLSIIFPTEYGDSFSQQYHVNHSSVSSLGLTTSWFITPGGIIGRSIYLKR